MLVNIHFSNLTTFGNPLLQFTMLTKTQYAFFLRIFPFSLVKTSQRVKLFIYLFIQEHLVKH